MHGKLSSALLRLGYRALNAIVIGTIISVTILAEAAQHTFPSWITVPLVLAGAAGVLIFIPLLAYGFAYEFGTPIVSLLMSRKPTLESNELTSRGEELARHLGLKARVKFRLKQGMNNAYSIPFGKRVVVGESLLSSPGERDATVAHELIHLTRSNYWNRLLTFAVYALPVFPLFWRESWLSLAILYPYTFALMVYPMKYAFYWGEYDADERGASLTSPEDMIAVLLHLIELHGDHGSFTHPSTSKRIRRLQKRFGQAH